MVVLRRRGERSEKNSWHTTAPLQSPPVPSLRLCDFFFFLPHVNYHTAMSYVIPPWIIISSEVYIFFMQNRNRMNNILFIRLGYLNSREMYVETFFFFFFIESYAGIRFCRVFRNRLPPDRHARSKIAIDCTLLCTSVLFYETTDLLTLIYCVYGTCHYYLYTPKRVRI